MEGDSRELPVSIVHPQNGRDCHCPYSKGRGGEGGGEERSNRSESEATYCERGAKSLGGESESRKTLRLLGEGGLHYQRERNGQWKWNEWSRVAVE